LESEKQEIERSLKHDPSALNKAELENTEEEIKDTESELATIAKEKEELEGKKKQKGKGTRRKHRSGKKWTSSATRKRSSMSASKGRRGRK
jgi:hypothetical protein